MPCQYTAGSDSGLGPASPSLGGGQHLGQELGRAGAPQDTQGGQHRQVQADTRYIFCFYQIFLWLRIEEMVTAVWPSGRSPRRHRRRRGRGRGRRRGHWDRGCGDGWRWSASEERSINEVSTECRTMRLQSTQLLTCLPLFLQLLLMEGRMCGCLVFTRMCDRGNINKVLVVSNVMCRY